MAAILNFLYYLLKAWKAVILDTNFVQIWPFLSILWLKNYVSIVRNWDNRLFEKLFFYYNHRASLTYCLSVCLQIERKDNIVA